MAERYQPRSVKQRPSGGRSNQADLTRSVEQERGRGSQSPEAVLKVLNTSMTSNSSSVPNMVSMNVYSGVNSKGGDRGGAKSGGQRYVFLFSLHS